MFHAKTGREVLLIVALLLLAAFTVTSRADAATNAMPSNCRKSNGGSVATVTCYTVPGLSALAVNGRLWPAGASGTLNVQFDCIDGRVSFSRKLGAGSFTFRLRKEASATQLKMLKDSVCDFNVAVKLNKPVDQRVFSSFSLTYDSRRDELNSQG